MKTSAWSAAAALIASSPAMAAELKIVDDAGHVPNANLTRELIRATTRYANSGKVRDT